MRILVCDDEFEYARLLESRIEKLSRGNDVEIITVASGEEVFQQKDLDKFDAVFLDIEMPGMSGIVIADELRKYNQYIHIIFVSVREELVFQSLVYRPFRFIRKSNLDVELEEAVKALISEVKKYNKYLMLGSSTRSYRIKISDIMYIASNKHELNVYTQKEIIVVRDTMTRIEKILSNYYFIRIHAGYLVNPKYIYSIENNSLILDDKTELPISRQKVAETKKKFFNYGSRG